jgi:hypothetical protein
MHDPKKALERWVTTLANTEATPQAIWTIAKSIINRDGPRAPTAIHGPLGINFHPLEKANAIAVEKQFTPHDLCEETTNGVWRLESKLYPKP